MMVFLIGMVGFAVDLGYVQLVRTELQNAVDSAAMASAADGQYQRPNHRRGEDAGGYHKAGGKTVSINSADVEFGTWDATARTFASSTSVGNAIRVTAKRDNSTGGNNMFFGKVFGVNTLPARPRRSRWAIRATSASSSTCPAR